MIPLDRVREKKAVTSGLRGARREAKNLALLKLKQKKGKLASKDFKSTWWKPAKDQLRAESFNKCAYCEADTKVVAHGDVEHFRPKTIYWWLAYCYENYLYACQICNQTYKSNKFNVSGTRLRAPRVTKSMTEDQLKKLAKEMTPDPLDDTSAPNAAAYAKAAINEKADLIDPYIIDPAKILVYEADDDTREVIVKVKPRAANRAAMQKALDDDFGLNREELRTARYQDYEIANRIATALKAGDDTIAAALRPALATLMAKEHRFAGMIRYFNSKVWKIDMD